MNFSQIIEMVNIGIVILDKDQKVHLWNRWMETHSNIPAEKVIGRSVLECFPELNSPKFHRNFKAVMAFGNFSFFSQKLHGYLFPFKTSNVIGADFNYMQQSCTMGPLRDENNRISHVFITVQDVTAIAAYEKKLLELNNKDPLTDIFNRRYLRSRLNEEFGKFKRYAHPFSLIMFDIDFFKPINDSYGHPCGDYILRALQPCWCHPSGVRTLWRAMAGKNSAACCRKQKLARQRSWPNVSGKGRQRLFSPIMKSN
jgi:diguanylate cyclase